MYDIIVLQQGSVREGVSSRHPNIAAVYGLEEGNGVRALVPELAEGPTLADRMARGPLHATRRCRTDI